MAGDTTRPRDATRWIETSRGVLSYAQLAPLLAERVLRLQQLLEAGVFSECPLDEDLILRLHLDFCGDLVSIRARLGRFDRQCAVTNLHTNRSKFSDSPAMKRWLIRIAHPQSVILASHLPDSPTQSPIGSPERSAPREIHPAASFSPAVSHPELRPPENPTAPQPHPLRSANPKPLHIARASDPRVPGPPNPATAESPLLLPEPYSCFQSRFNRPGGDPNPALELRRPNHSIFRSAI